MGKDRVMGRPPAHHALTTRKEIRARDGNVRKKGKGVSAGDVQP